LQCPQCICGFGAPCAVTGRWRMSLWCPKV
jgi:hypothetical protein